MSHLHRFFVSPDTADDGAVQLGQEELHHALHVLRLREGDRVSLFDGTGRELVASVSRVDRRTLLLEIQESTRVAVSEHDLHLVQAWLNHEKSIEPLIKRCTEVGVDRITFFQGDHSERAPRHVEKWKRWAVESCKQCRRSYLPVFSHADTLEEALASAAQPMLIATLDSAPTPLTAALDGREECTLIIGPEGDFSEQELVLTDRRNATRISLGEHTLRSEVAASVAATLVNYEWGRLGPR